MTKEDIQKLHATRRALYNKKYKDDVGNEYIGLENGRIQKIIAASDTKFNTQNDTITTANNVQKAIEELVLSVNNITTLLTALTDRFNREFAVERVTVDKSSDFTSRYYEVECSTSNITITLPSASDFTGLTCDFERIDSTTYIATIVASGADTINNDTSLLLFPQEINISLFSNGTNWSII